MDPGLLIFVRGFKMKNEPPRLLFQGGEPGRTTPSAEAASTPPFPRRGAFKAKYDAGSLILLVGSDPSGRNGVRYHFISEIVRQGIVVRKLHVITAAGLGYRV